jgi:hypothetical protein
LHTPLDGDGDHEQKEYKKTVEPSLASVRTSQRTLNYTDHSGDIASKMCVGPHVQYPSLLSHFNQIQKPNKKSRNFTKKDHTKFRGSWTCRKASRSVRTTERPTDGRTLRGY